MPLTSTTADAMATAYCAAINVTDSAAISKWKQFAELMYSHLKTDATVTAGIPVATTGSASAQTGSTTAPGTLT